MCKRCEADGAKFRAEHPEVRDDAVTIELNRIAMERVFAYWRKISEVTTDKNALEPYAMSSEDIQTYLIGLSDDEFNDLTVSVRFIADIAEDTIHDLRDVRRGRLIAKFIAAPNN